MISVFAILFLISIAASETCGTFKNSCHFESEKNINQVDYFTLTVDKTTNYYTNSTYHIGGYSDSNCAMTSFSAITIPAAFSFKSAETSDNLYSVYFGAGTISFSTDSYKEKNIVCTPEPAMETSYPLDSIVCMYNNVDIYSEYKNMKGEHELTVTSTESLFTINGTTYNYENKSGCNIIVNPPNDIILYIVYIVVFILVICIVIYFYYDLKKNKDIKKTAAAIRATLDVKPENNSATN